MRLLLYGFKPYGPYQYNISEQIIRALPDNQDIEKRVFSVVFDYQMFYKAFREVAPDIIIGMGQHPRARKIRIERKARNSMKLSDGKLQTIKSDAPSARITNLKLPESDITTVTYDAGTYVCNYSMFVMAEYSHRSASRFGFIHLPLGMNNDSMKSYISKSCDQLLDNI